MKIISFNNDKKISATINCDCGTNFEIEVGDIQVKGKHLRMYYVHCPNCNKVHDYSSNMTEKNKKEIVSYINCAKSCTECQNMEVIKEGTSNHTITKLILDCRLKKNKRMPITGREDSYEIESVYSFAEKCESFMRGKFYVKEVEEPLEDAQRRWENSNKNSVEGELTP